MFVLNLEYYGEGVNIAARIETLAEPGGICISDVIYKQINSKLELGYTDLGEQTLKGFDEPVRAYGARLALGETTPAPEPLAMPQPAGTAEASIAGT